MWLSLSISGHTLVMESPKLGQRVKLFKSFSSFNALTLGPSLRDSITKVWPKIERLSHILSLHPIPLAGRLRLKGTAPYENISTILSTMFGSQRKKGDPSIMCTGRHVLGSHELRPAKLFFIQQFSFMATFIRHSYKMDWMTKKTTSP